MTRWFNANDGYKPEDLVHFANDHLYAAGCLYRQRDLRTLDSAGFLAHLAVELLLKAMLLHRTQRFPDDHGLNRLLDRVRKEIPDFEIPVPGPTLLELLDPYHRLRYPRPKDLLGVAEGDWPAIEHLVAMIRSQLPSALQAVGDSATANEKAGRKVLNRRAGPET